MEGIVQLGQTFLLQPVTPAATWPFENALPDRLRERGRGILEVLSNRLEADDPDEMPKHVEFDRQQFSRKNETTENRGGIGTLFGKTVFGKISLVHFSDEPLGEARDDKQQSVSPLARCWGIVAGNASPALAERVGRVASSHTQRELLEWLEGEHRVGWSGSGGCGDGGNASRTPSSASCIRRRNTTANAN